MVDQNRWPSLAQDLAVMMVPDSPIISVEQICRTYKTTHEELKSLLTIPKFQSLYNNALEEFKAQGTSAGLVFRTKQLSIALSEMLFNKSIDGTMDTKDTLKLLEMFFKVSGAFKEKEAQVNTQVNVGFTLPLPKGIKKLEHLETIDAV